MTLADPNNQVDTIAATESPIENQSTATSSPADEPSPPTGQSETQSAESSPGVSSRRILIGSQRDPVAYRARTKRDWTPIVEGDKQKKSDKGERKGSRNKPKSERSSAPPSTAAAQPPRQPIVQPAPQQESLGSQSPIPSPSVSAPATRPEPAVPNLDFDDELSGSLNDASMDEWLGAGSQAGEESFEPESTQSGRVVAVRRDDVFVEFAGRQQGVVSLRQFDVPPRPGVEVQVVVQRLNPEDGLYELSLPNKAVQVDDWSDLIEGALVEVHVTGHNTGGLECEVNHIRGFIPMSQVSIYRVEDFASYVDQRLTCLISEADPDRRNLVLSRRAVLEREKEQAREQMLGSLQPGQVYDGVVRKLMDFGAFVDIGGIDGLLHISQLAWGRVKHPSDVLKEGQAIKVRIEKVDPTTGKISLAYRDMLESPWTAAAQKYPARSVVRGTITKLMDFGAFVELEPGIEGLVHVSELSHKRVWRPADVVKEGEQVEVLVLSIDPAAQRMSLSMKAISAPTEPAKSDDSSGDATPKKPAKPTGPLLGGLGRKTGERFGLKW